MASLKSGTTIGTYTAIHTNNIGSYALTSVPSNVITTSGGQTIAGITYFSNGESLNLYGIRGRFTNEYIHLYNKVGIGSPNGWGAGEGYTPGYGLSTYGGIVVAYGNNATSSFNGHLRIDRNWGLGDYGAEQFTIRGSSPSITFRDTSSDSKWLMHIDSGNVNFYYGGSVDNNSWGRKFFIPTDGNIWMSWAGDYISNLLGAKQNASTAITTSNIGSQSVSYASSAGNADTLDGLHASSLTYVPIWTNNTQNAARSGFVSGSNWYRIANLGTERFFARVRIYDDSSGGPHSSVEFQVAGAFNASGSYSFTLTSNGYYSAPSVTQVRILSAGTYDPQYLEVYIAYVGYSSSTFAVSLLEARNATVVNWENGGIPSGYAATTWDANGPLAAGGRAAIFNSGVYNTNDYSRFGNVLVGEGTYKNTIKPIGDTNLNISTASGAVYFDTYGQASGSFRAPIFYDSNDTGYYLDPNGTSNLLQLTTATRARWNMPRVWYDRSSRTSDQGYWTGTNGWGAEDGTWANAWKGGFSGWDIWGTGTDHPQGGGYIHAQGIVSGQHYATSSVGYGWMMVGAANATDNRYWLRGKWDTTTSSWVEMITTGNIASQSVSYADESGYSASSGSVEWTSVQNKPATFPPSSHNHDDRYLVKGGGWYGVGLPGSRWGGFSVSGGEIVFGDGLPNAGQMGILIDGAYLAGENNGFWSLASDNSWSSRRGMYWDGSNLNFTANSPTALFNSIRLSTSTNNGTISGGGDWGIRFANDNGWIQFGPANNSWTHIYSDKNFYMNTHLWVSGGYKVTAWDYNNGGGALYATVFYDANDTGYYVDPNSTSYLYHLVLSGNSYFRPNTWIQFDGNYGVYWPNHYGLHLYPNTDGSYGSLQVKGIKNSWHGIHFDSGSTLMMNSGETGVHRQGVGWQWRWYNGEMYISAGSTGGGTERTVIHSGNIGSQSVNYATSAGSASSSSRSSALDIVGYGNGNMTYYQTSGTFAGYSGWAGYFVSNHGDGATYYNQTIIMPFWGPPQYSRLQGGTFAGPYTFWSTENLNDYAPNMNQYVRTTDNVTFNTITSPTILVNNHSDNTKGYRIHNTSGASVSAMFTNSSNQLVIAAGAVDQINLNKKVYVNGVALGVNVTPSATAGRIDASNDIVAYSTSDERFKENITPIPNALDKVKSLTGVEFDWKPEYKHAHGYEGHDTGIIAQQVEAIMPSAVRTNDTGFLAVRYEKLIGLLIEGMKEQQAQIDELKAKLDGIAS